MTPPGKEINFVTRDILKNRIFGFLEEEGIFYAQIIILTISFFEDKDLFVGKVIDFTHTRGPARPKIRNIHTTFLTNFYYWECHNTRNS